MKAIMTNRKFIMQIYADGNDTLVVIDSKNIAAMVVG